MTTQVVPLSETEYTLVPDIFTFFSNRHEHALDMCIQNAKPADNAEGHVVLAYATVYKDIGLSYWLKGRGEVAYN